MSGHGRPFPPVDRNQNAIRRRGTASRRALSSYPRCAITGRWATHSCANIRPPQPPLRRVNLRVDPGSPTHHSPPDSVEVILPRPSTTPRHARTWSQRRPSRPGAKPKGWDPPVAHLSAAHPSTTTPAPPHTKTGDPFGPPARWLSHRPIDQFAIAAGVPDPSPTVATHHTSPTACPVVSPGAASLTQ